MSKIHSIWVAVGSSAAAMFGTAKKSTETSMETRSRGRQRTASAVHSRRPAVEDALIKPNLCRRHSVYAAHQNLERNCVSRKHLVRLTP